MNDTYRREHLKEMLTWSLEEKIEYAKNRIVEFYNAMEGKVYIAYSGGKDSTVLLHLVRSIYPDVVAVFSNTTNEYSEILTHVRNTSNVIWLQPKMSFVETVEKFGFPLTSKMNARKIRTIRQKGGTASANLYLTGINRKGEYHEQSMLPNKWKFLVDAPFDVTEQCCDILKKQPFQKFETQTKLKPFIGTQAQESMFRRKNWIDHGCNIVSGNHIMSRPLSIFTEKDIWDYIHKYNIPYAAIYNDIYDDQGNLLCKGETRTGCAYCAYGLNLDKPDELGMGRFDRLKFRKPKQFQKMMQLQNNGVTFEEALMYTYERRKK